MTKDTPTKEELITLIPKLQTKLSLATNDYHQSLNRIRTMPEEDEFYTRFFTDVKRVDDLFNDIAAKINLLRELQS